MRPQIQRPLKAARHIFKTFDEMAGLSLLQKRIVGIGAGRPVAIEAMQLAVEELGGSR